MLESVLAAPIDGLIFEAVVLAGSGGVIFWSWFSSSRQWIRRKLARLPRSSLGVLQENTLARVIGTVKRLEHTVVAPISGETCVFYKIQVDFKGPAGWKTVIQEAHGTPFLIEDDTAYAIIDPLAANITTHHLRFFPADRPDPFLDRFLARHRIRHKHALRCHEMRIELGATITVLGSGIGERDPLAAQPEGYRAERTTCLRFSGSKKYPLVISDDPSLR